MYNTDIEQFRGRLINELWKSENARISKRSLKEILYHLTDIEGMVGIFNERTLWATHASRLNDETEISYGIGVAKAHILTRLHPPPNSESTPDISLSNKYNNILGIILNILEAPYKNYETFVTSFCESIDKSTPWLHYGRKGRGVALGFDSSRLKGGGYLLLPVEYGESEMKNVIDNAMKVAQSELDNSKMSENKDAFNSACDIVSSFIKVQAIRFKNDSFDEEKEWRLIYWMPVSGDNSFRIKFRVSDNQVIPYATLSLGYDTPIIKIVLGYSSSMNENDEGLKLFVGKEVNIRKSNVSVR